ncbi:hypothetical protein LSAT2_019939 [Lamellibrachia satsuma]|nr:hypothetical protein LSAT2_019939 [Lamellibrachia satsuma]
MLRKRKPEELARKYYKSWYANMIANRSRRTQEDEAGSRTHGTIEEEADGRRSSHDSEPPASLTTENEVEQTGKCNPQRQISTTSAKEVTTVTTPSAKVAPIVITPSSKVAPTVTTPSSKVAPTVTTPSSKGTPTVTTPSSKGTPTVPEPRRKSASVAAANKSGSTAADKRDSVVSRSAGSLTGKATPKAASNDKTPPPLRPKSGFKAATVQPTTAKKTTTTPRPGTGKKTGTTARPGTAKSTAVKGK